MTTDPALTLLAALRAKTAADQVAAFQAGLRRAGGQA